MSDPIIVPTTSLQKLRDPFPAHLVSKLPKPTKQQTEDVKADFKKGIRCEICGGWHHPKVVHLDYIGHAALTDRLLETDINWNWEPLSMNQQGLPMIDENGGMWIKLTVCGQTRLGYGHSDGKKGGDAIKEVIGDALRNAAMRFGAALDLWHKGDLHGNDEIKEAEPKIETPIKTIPTNEQSTKAPNPKDETPVNIAQQKELFNLADSLKISYSSIQMEMKKRYNVNKTPELKVWQFNDLLNMMREMK